MIIRVLRLLFISTLAALYACSGGKVELKDRNFSDEIEQRQNLVFRFSHHLVADSMLNAWDSLPYVSFDPVIKGKFRWTANDELTFSPETGFAPSTDYKASLTDNILNAYKGEKLSLEKGEPILFHTPYLKLLNADIFWTKDQSGRIGVRFNLNFNYRVNPQEVAHLLNLQIDGKKATYEVKSTVLAEKVEIMVAQAAGRKLDGKPVKITIDKGLKSVESSFVSKEPMVIDELIPNKDKFEVLQVNPEYDGSNGFLRVITSQGLGSGNIAEFIKFKPAVKIKVEHQEQGFLVKGDFEAGTSYELSISKNLKDIFGGDLGKDYQQFVVFGVPEPAIAFTSKSGLYLTSNGDRNIGLNIINIEKINVAVYKIYENNLLGFLSNAGGYYYSEYDEGDGEEYFSPYQNYEGLGDVIYNKVVAVSSLQKNGNTYLLNLNFDDINAFKGIYIVKVNDESTRWRGVSKTVVISDIGMIVKQTPEEILVFANSIRSAEPMGSVNVQLVSSNNQQVYEAATDANGIARFENISKKAPGFKVQMIAAQHGQDFTYLHFNQTRVETSRYDVAGARNNPAGYQAFIYGDRNIYRPGETVHLNTILRSDDWNKAADLPVKLKVVLPNGRELTTLRGTLNKEGAFASSVKLPEAAVTGNYNIEVYTANDVLLNSRTINVEEFMPDRIKVTLTLDKKEVKPGETFTAGAVALNLFGPPAADRNFETDFSIRKKAFRPKGFQGYNFTIEGGQEISFENEFRQGKTSADGELKESFKIPAEMKNMGILTGRVYTTVFDETGRPVNRAASIDILTQPVFYGIKLFNYYLDVRQPVQIPLVALDKDGKPVNAAATVQFVKYDWHTVLEKNDYGRLRYISQKKERILEERKVQLSKVDVLISFTPSTSGEYEIRVMQPGAVRYVKEKFYAYGMGYTANTSFEVNKEGQVIIETDKEKYEVGEQAQLLFKTPFAGKLLVTIERDKVHEHFYLDTDNKSASLSIPVTEAYMPNAYISATLIKPLDDGTMPLTVAHGYVPLMVEKKASAIPLEIVAVEKSRSNTRQKITVKSTAGADVEVTLAVVDEGILQLKDYRTPDPHGFFYQKKALEVSSYDLYPRLFPDLAIRLSSTGGDGYDLSRRVNPLPNRRSKLMAYWSGTLKTNSDGEASYTIDIPHFSGDLRIMAVAYKGKSFGSASKNIKVADPIVVSSALPRFLSPGDEMQINVTLTNTTDKPAHATAQLGATGSIKGMGGNQTITIPANSEAQVQFELAAANSIGESAVTVTASAFGEIFKEETKLNVRPVTSLVKHSDSGIIEEGKAASVNFAQNYLPGTAQTKLLVSRSPLVQFADNLNQLIGYPHGCAEQTISKAFPQLYVHELSKTLQQQKGVTQSADANVNEAIRKIQSMQIYNGGIAYWPGSDDVSWWATAYAGHFLIEARKAGFEVSSQVLDKIMTYLTQKVKEKKTENYAYYNDADVRQSRSIAPKEAAYSLYILSLAGRPEVPTMNYYKSRQAVLALDNKYLLAAAYRLAGDASTYQSLLPANFEGEKSVNATGGSFYSFIRDQAISLNALVETDFNNPQVGKLAGQLSEQLKRERYLNTQENAFAILALGKIAKKASQGNATAQIMAGGTKVADFSGADVLLTQQLQGKAINIKASGTGSLYYFAESSGLQADGQVKEEDKVLRVRKTFLDRNGNVIGGSSFNQNDLVVVKLTIATADNSDVENVVITDMLPAGFEIENPRLSSGADLPWLKNTDHPQHFDIRDDRINLYTNAGGSTKTFYYMVRAVSPGRFKIGPVSADAMYNGNYYSYSGAGEIEVR
jgi:uncharacterized protein YfaS (alpha-2-macroglobulin family)